jgi:opacity protein-like surface antigen
MSKFKLIGAAALLSVAIATPAFAQQAVQEPGEQAFYQSLGVGSHNYGAPYYGAANALASGGNVNLSVAPARHHLRGSKHRQ